MSPELNRTFEVRYTTGVLLEVEARDTADAIARARQLWPEGGLRGRIATARPSVGPPAVRARSSFIEDILATRRE